MVKFQKETVFTAEAPRAQRDLYLLKQTLLAKVYYHKKVMISAEKLPEGLSLLADRRLPISQQKNPLCVPCGSAVNIQKRYQTLEINSTHE